MYELLEVLKPFAGILGASITAVVSFAIAAYSYYKTKKLKFYEIYFSKKTEAYEQFFKCVLAVEEPVAEDIMTATARALLYCNTNLLPMLKKFSQDTIKAHSLYTLRSADALSEYKKLAENIVLDKNKIIDAMRKDLKDCRKHKFD